MILTTVVEPCRGLKRFQVHQLAKLDKLKKRENKVIHFDAYYTVKDLHGVKNVLFITKNLSFNLYKITRIDHSKHTHLNANKVNSNKID